MLFLAGCSANHTQTMGTPNDVTQFETTAKHALEVIHAEEFAKGNVANCVSLYVSKLGTGFFESVNGSWKIKTMNVYGPEKWKSSDGVQIVPRDG